MECPCCESELAYEDWYYTGNYSAYEKGYEDSGFKKLGDIYKCSNEECDYFEEYFHTRNNDDSQLFEGYPC
ncbi:hypothetical protein Q7A53_05550 [Halobacillus rhizosphaerae]|uniref:hypothetical protein n=1 Tax=Halobacillus rhizosphaerae TaxID=3064889 RepID=UPI00398A7FB4